MLRFSGGSVIFFSTHANYFSAVTTAVALSFFKLVVPTSPSCCRDRAQIHGDSTAYSIHVYMYAAVPLRSGALAQFRDATAVKDSF